MAFVAVGVVNEEFVHARSRIRKRDVVGVVAPTILGAQMKKWKRILFARSARAGKLERRRHTFPKNTYLSLPDIYACTTMLSFTLSYRFLLLLLGFSLSNMINKGKSGLKCSAWTSSESAADSTLIVLVLHQEHKTLS